ncbi:long-chain fatty acid--CoA ligase [Bradyrhizobium sp. CCBAU 11386]|uniref:class I adenylate-forming enzyme family protein n=1 Tax=Bradyrhizobium sp. CCBAU 11386 TaxID=1630837 RepID=UPI00230442F1|nr:AMP-binding protein [Bradyrhizobium sp. CCBAU 11386]MDA9509881.1 long-chain fatty acid--CoA ligase [Bradyrhizobium sp. CCBAU 11386]
MSSVDAFTAAELLNGLPSRVHEVYGPFVRDMPDQPAFVEGGRPWSYRQFSDAVDAATKDLAGLGIGPGDRVIIASENSVALGAMLFAASKLDAWGIPANPRLSPREVDLIAMHSGAKRVLFNSALSKEAADHANRVGAKIGAVGPFGGIGIGSLNAAAQAEPVEEDGARQVAGLLYTSGTTGAPKGVMLSHRNLLFTAKTSGVLRQSRPGDRIYGVLPMSHIVGYSILLIATLMHGCTLHVVAKAVPAALAHAIAEEGITSLFGVPATYQRLLEYKAVKGIQRLERGSLRVMAVAGAPLDLDLKKRIEDEFGIPLLNNYGITECSPGLSGVRSEHPVSDESVGPFLPGIEHRIVDGQSKKVAPGEVGELHVRGPNVMLGYYRAPDLTAAAINSEGWFNTGDLARVNADGHLYIAGRTKELIIRSGFNVYPAEVEAVLNAHDQVVQSAVVGRKTSGNEEVVAFVQLLPGASVNAEDLKTYTSQLLTSYKRPTEVIVLDVLPSASTGKILKHKLREMANARVSAETSSATAAG